MELIGPGGYVVSDDVERIDRAYVAAWLATQSYWAIGRPREVQDRAIDGSLAIGLYAPDGTMAGFCRFVTDRATFAWLCDVFVDGAHRGRGLGAFMVQSAVEHPDVADVRRQVLISSTAQPLYARFGYEPLGEQASLWMARNAPT